jgi:hypothetical protein
MTRLVGLMLLCCTAAQAGAWQGRPVAALLDALRASGIEVLYSSDLVPASLTIAQEPHGALLDGAREVLSAAGLRLQPIGPRHYAVTRASAAPMQAGEPAAPAPAGAGDQLQQVTMYASRYALQSREAGSHYDLRSGDIEQAPTPTNDPLRAAFSLPGLASSLSARPYVRGSLQDDVLVRFDGIALADPFHLKNFQSLVSAFDPSMIERLELYSGGFPVRYGTRSGAVINLEPMTLGSGQQYEIGASGLTAQASTVGRDRSGDVQYLAGARTSTVDLVLDPLRRNLGDPQFSDLITRVRWQATEQSAWIAGVLALDDRLHLLSDASTKRADADYRDVYGWLAFEHAISQPWQARTAVSVTRSERQRAAQVAEPDIAVGTMQEQREFSSYTLTSDWRYAAAERASWDLGVQYQWIEGDAQYRRSVQFPSALAAVFGRSTVDDLAYAVQPSQRSYAAYAAVRPWLGPRLQSELGLRLDGQRESSGARNSQWSPRINLRYRVFSRVDAYGSWGRFTQAQRPDEWRLEEGQSTAQPVQIATHVILGLLYRPQNAPEWRIEAYHKHWDHVSPYFDNVLDTLTLDRELAPDWVRIAPRAANAHGLEVSLRYAYSESLATWSSFTWSRVSDVLPQGDVPRAWDQPHAFNAGVAWTRPRYALAAVLNYHSGWPRTTLGSLGTSPGATALQLGARDASRWGSYLSLDLRGSWTKPLASSEIKLWADLTNATNHGNACCVDLQSAGLTMNNGDPAQPQRQVGYWLPRVANLGITWRFH